MLRMVKPTGQLTTIRDFVNRFAIVFLLILALCAGFAFAGNSDDALITEAKQYLSEGKVKAAVIQLKNLLRDSPLNADARLLLGQAYVRLGDGPSAVKELEKAKDLRLSKEQWIIPLAKAYLLVGKPKKLLQKLDLDQAYSSELRSTLKSLHGDAYFNLRDYDAAKESYDEALKLNGSSALGLLGKAKIRLLHKQFESATKFANESIAIDGENAVAWTLLGEIHRLQGNNENASAAFEKAIKINPNHVNARIGRAVLSILTKNFESAQQDLSFISKNIGTYPPAMYLQSVIAYQQKKHQEAEDLLVQVINFVPDHLPSRLLLGTIAYSRNNLESADNHLSRYVGAIPNHLPAAKLLAAVKMKQKQAADAVSLLSRVEEAGRDDPQYLALLGSAYMQTGEFDRGTELLTKATQLAPNVAAIHAQLALGQIAAGRIDEAVGQLENAVDLGQGLIQADALLVMALLQQKKFDDALEAAKRIAKKMPDNPMPFNLMAAAYLAKGEKNEAVKQWKHALSIKPDYATAALNLAKLEVQEKNFKRANKWYRSILKHQPRNVRAMIGLAQVAEKQKSYEKMVEWLETARDKNPDNLEPMLMLSKYYLLRGKSLQALEIARDASARHPDNDLALKTLGVSQQATGNTASAIRTFRNLIRRSQGKPEPHHLLAQILFKDSRIKEANKEWEHAIELSPKYLPSIVARAESALKEKDFDTALELSKTVQNYYPQSPLGYRILGDVEQGRNHPEKARQAYHQAYQIHKTAGLARRLFQIYIILEDHTSGFALLEKWLEQSPKDVASWALLAMGYQKIEKNEKAIRCYEKAYQLAPNNRIVVNNLAWLYQEKGDNRALELAEDILDLAHSDPQIADTAGWIFVQNGKLDKGLVLLQQAAVLAPHIPEIRVHLAEALIQAGRRQEAGKELSRLLKEKKDFPGRERAEDLLKLL